MFDDMTDGAVESELVEIAGHLAAGTCRFLHLLAEFDTRQGWSGPGLRSCAHWLGWRVGLNLRTARDHLRVAHALAHLPAITAAFAGGRLSYSKVRALTRIATPATEDGLLDVALHGTTSQLEALVAAARAGLDPRPAAARRSLRWSTAADGSLLVSIRMPAEQGEQFVAEIEAALAASSAARPPDPVDLCTDPAAALEHAPGPVLDPLAARRLDALLDLITGDAPERPTTLVVHLRADDQTGPDDAETDHRPAAWIEGGPPVTPATARRLACTAAVQALLVDRAGNPLYLGRTRRMASRRQLRALSVRDRGRCVFPGCDATRHLKAHHITWWQHLGPTDLDNLALVCAFHHTLIHDHGYGLTRSSGDGGPAATRPDGTVVPTAGPPTTGDADELIARHAAAQVTAEIDDATITPDWFGERLDRDQALGWLLPTLDREREAGPCVNG